VSFQRPVAQGSGYEGAATRAGGDGTVVFQLSIGLEHGVGIDGEARHHVLYGGELVAYLEQSESQGAANLVHQLQVWCDTGTRVEMKLDHD
jgi:hypothetical protein